MCHVAFTLALTPPVAELAEPGPTTNTPATLSSQMEAVGLKDDSGTAERLQESKFVNKWWIGHLLTTRMATDRASMPLRGLTFPASILLPRPLAAAFAAACAVAICCLCCSYCCSRHRTTSRCCRWPGLLRQSRSVPLAAGVGSALAAALLSGAASVYCLRRAWGRPCGALQTLLHNGGKAVVPSSVDVVPKGQVSGARWSLWSTMRRQQTPPVSG